MNKDFFQKVLNFAYFYLKFRPRTKKEIIKYLQKKSLKYHFSLDLINQVVEHLIQVDLINDREFISLFIQQRNTLKPKSRYILSHELIRLGIEKDLIEQYFSEHEIDEYALANQALSKRKTLLNNLNDKKSYQKAYNFLLRRGFSFEIAKKTIAKFTDKE